MSAKAEARTDLSLEDLRELLKRKTIAALGLKSGGLNEPHGREQSLRLARTVPLLAGLPPATIQRLLTGCLVQSYRAGAILFGEADQVRQLHVPLNGLVELFTSESGRDRTLLIMSPGEVFMPAAALDRHPYPLSARALRPLKALLLDAPAVSREMLTCPAFASRITGITNAQLRTVLSELNRLRSRTGPQRLAAFLLRLIDESPLPTSAELPFPKKVLASRMGISAETLSRSLQVLAENGLALRGGRAVLLDRTRAARFCREEPARAAHDRSRHAQTASFAGRQVRHLIPVSAGAEACVSN